MQIFLKAQEFQRFLNFAKSDRMCDCGCHGYCTVDAIHRWLIHVLTPFSYRRMPTERHDKMNWIPGEDDSRRDLAGLQTACWGACLGISGDWPELCFTCGLQSHRSHSSPCVCCTCSTEDMFDWPRYSLGDMSFPEITQEDYNVMVARNVSWLTQGVDCCHCLHRLKPHVSSSS